MSALLEIGDLRAGYGAGDVLQGIDLAVETGQVVAVLGRNGVGKTTLVHSVMGMVRPASGSIRLGGEELAGRPSHAIAQSGIALVPQGRRIFSRLSVEENLKLARRSGNSAGWTLERVYDLLPRLAERRRHGGSQLSGGEQQMVAIGRALLSNPRVILFDEPSEGLAPLVVDTITEMIGRLCKEGLSALLVEQNLHVALGVADSVNIMTRGQIVYRAATSDFRRDPDTARALLGAA